MTTTLDAPATTPAKGAGITLVALPDPRRGRWWYTLLPLPLLVALGIVAVAAAGGGGDAVAVDDGAATTAVATTTAASDDAGDGAVPVTAPDQSGPPSATTSTTSTAAANVPAAVPPTDQPAVTSSSSSSTSSSSTSSTSTTTSSTTTTTAPPPAELVANAVKSAVLASIAGSNCPPFAQNGIPKQGGPFNFTIRRSSDDWTMTISDGRSASTTNGDGVDVSFPFASRTAEPVPGLMVTTQMTETMTFAGTSLSGTNVTRYTFTGTAGGFDYTGVECVATFAVTGTLSQPLA